MAFSLVSIKRFPYRDNPAEEYSNRYNFTGTTPADAAAWRTLFDALAQAEKLVLTARVDIIRAYGYPDTDQDSDSVWSVDLRVAPNAVVTGTFNTGVGGEAAGDVAVWVRWKRATQSSTGKNVYLRKYFHPAFVGSPTVDSIVPAQQNALNTFATTLQTGLLGGAHKICDKTGAEAVSHGVSTYATTRTLKRRGKRLPS